jgi:hypothetical protein
MDHFCTSAANIMTSAIFKDLNFNLFDNSSVFYVRLFDVRLPEDDLKKIETCRSISELYVKLCILVLVRVLVVTVRVC